MNIKQSGIATRMADNHRKLSLPAKLNLVSLMDIFTILVFFLLVNSGDSQLIQNNKDITLPASVSKLSPDETLVVSVSESGILVGGKEVATMEEVIAGSGAIGGLAVELQLQAASRPELSEYERLNGRAVTVMGDQELPYEVLKRVMVTCAEANYRDLSLAVAQLANAG